MGLKVYIAAPWVAKNEALEAQKKFEEAGMEVTSHWIKYHPTVSIEGADSTDINELQTQAIEDVEDIIKSDVFVILNLALSEGKATELGLAYGLGIPIILVGKRDRNIFYHLPEVYQADTVDEAVRGILVAENQMEAGN